MKYIVKFFVITFLLITSTYVSAEQNIVFMDMKQILNTSKAGKGAQDYLQKIFEDGQEKYGPREWSPNIIKRLEDATGISVLAPGFPSDIIDTEVEEEGYEVKPTGSH